MLTDDELFEKCINGDDIIPSNTIKTDKTIKGQYIIGEASLYFLFSHSLKKPLNVIGSKYAAVNIAEINNTIGIK